MWQLEWKSCIYLYVNLYIPSMLLNSTFKLYIKGANLRATQQSVNNDTNMTQHSILLECGPSVINSNSTYIILMSHVKHKPLKANESVSTFKQIYNPTDSTSTINSSLDALILSLDKQLFNAIILIVNSNVNINHFLK